MIQLTPALFTVQVAELCEAATRAGLAVIPLVQTFGHMEFVLKLPEWRHLREVAFAPNSLRPVGADQSGEVAGLLLELVRQVVAAHPGLTAIHIGGDEVWGLGQGEATKQTLQTRGVTLTELVLEHLTLVAETARAAGAGQVLCWDDMLRGAEREQLAGLARLVQPVVWDYSPSLALPPDLLARYTSVWGADRVWAGSCWRGASGPAQQVTPIRLHLANTLAWLGVNVPLAGLVLTGWSRYDHFATLCEPLPAALPSLCCCLAAATAGTWDGETHRAASIRLGVPALLPLEGGEDVVLRYPGSELYSMLTVWAGLAARHTALLASPARAAWCNTWQLSTGQLNPLQVRGLVRELRQLARELHLLQPRLELILTSLLHKFTAEEWVATNLTPRLAEIQQILDKVTSVIDEEELGCDLT